MKTMVRLGFGIKTMVRVQITVRLGLWVVALELGLGVRGKN